ncbi:MAG: glycoside hydrolase family 3 C-terminal domain-containing protein [Novosphingobium sp.]|nr:glycoside hydrolase family 3 C-terminal domain-containing protein [Novosphingobium sp.]
MKRNAGVAVVALALAGPLGAGATTPAPGFRDLNHNGRMDPYENSQLSDEARTEDLIAQMTLEEKAATLLHGTLPAVGSPIGAGNSGYDMPAVETLVKDRGITSMISRLAVPPAMFAAQNNAVQSIAASSRLGIPVTISTDPRNHFSVVGGASVAATGFTQWPEPLGLAALDDDALVRQFGAIAATEYRAVGLHMALSPQADLATEPRWSRALATFGADPAKVSRLAAAYVEGFQGGASGLARSGVATIVKHFVGYGAEPEGFDGHNAYGAKLQLTNASFARHLAAFAGPLKAGSAGIMPTYGIVTGVTIDGKPMEQVGAGFNATLLQDLLRKKMGYRGLVVSDWGIVNDCSATCSRPTADNPQTPSAIAMPWGVEKLTVEQRVAKGVNAGIDQFGGFADPAPLLAAVRSGAISQARLDDAVRQVMLVKFRLGLFDNPFVDETAAARIVGAPQAAALAAKVQSEAQVLLQNRKGTIPLAPTLRKIWLHGVSLEAARLAGFQVVADPAQADVALIRMASPAEKLHPYHFFGNMQDEGRLDFRDGDAGYDALRSVAGRLPVIVAVDMNRPAILTNVQGKADAMLALYGASDAALLDVVSGKIMARGHLPVELPRSMAAVEAQRPDLPNDSRNPLYAVGFGLEEKAR